MVDSDLNFEMHFYIKFLRKANPTVVYLQKDMRSFPFFRQRRSFFSAYQKVWNNLVYNSVMSGQTFLKEELSGD